MNKLNYLKIQLVLLLLATGVQSAFAQKEIVFRALAKYKIDQAVLNPNLKDNSSGYYYDLERTVEMGPNKKKVYLSNYDPAKSGAERYTLLSVNGKAPSKHEIKAFDDEHAMQLNFRVDDSSYRVLNDDGNILAISYQYDPASVDHEHSFLKDCSITLFIDAKTGKLQRSLEQNLKDLKIKILKVTKLQGEAAYAFNSKDNKYLVTNEQVAITVKMLGVEMPMVTTDRYTYRP